MIPSRREISAPLMGWAVAFAVGGLIAACMLGSAPALGATAPGLSITGSIGASTKYEGDGGGSLMPMLGLAKPLSERVDVRVQAAHLGYSYAYYYPTLRAWQDASFTILAAGLRLWVGPSPGSRPGVFLEALPTIGIARWSDRYGRTTRALPGLLEGAGLSFPASKRLRVEVSVGYVLSQGAELISLDAEPVRYEGLGQGVIALTCSWRLSTH